jgi:hypothetical protein
VVTPFKKPNLNAPRFRPKKHNLLNQEFFEQFLRDHPRFTGLTIQQFKSVINLFNGMIWEKVVALRDGVELPEQLGYLFIGSCPRKKGENTDYLRSAQLGVKVQHRNWESDQYTAKIFYTNYETKYRFKHHDMWGFSAVRDFKRTVGQTYPLEWKKYVLVDNMMQVAQLFRKRQYQDYIKHHNQSLLDHYDEFDLD